MKRIVFFVLLFALTCSMPLHSFALASDKPDTMEINKDSFYAGEIYQIPSIEVEHNLFLIGSTVKNNANTGKDVFALGNNYTQSGTTKGNAFLCGNKIWIEGAIQGDVFVIGNIVEISPESTIEGNLFVVCSTLTMEGIVDGLVQFSGDTIRFIGKSSGADMNANTIIIEDGAQIHQLRYNSNASLSVSDNAEIVTIDMKPMPTKPVEIETPPPRKSFPVRSKVFALLSSLLLAFLVFYLFHTSSKKALDTLKNHFWTSLGIGLLFLIALPVCLLVLFVIGFGWKVALSLLFGATAMWMFSHALAGIATGYFVFQWIAKKERFDWLNICIGVVTLFFIQWIPVVGRIFSFLLTTLSFGAFLQVLWKQNRMGNKE
ncbi:MAG: polymer-forming cytoskeletal protein [Caldisericia bacterium]|nr:polymer-forming cytoskeletal protein [Caldisericia bacterium]